jgi:hypothetical protein
MKSTNKAQTIEALNEKAIALHWQDCIIEELSDEAQPKFLTRMREELSKEIN